MVGSAKQREYDNPRWRKLFCRHKLITKYSIIMEENIYTTRNGKSSEFKNNGKKKGLSQRNAENHAVCRTTVGQQCPAISKGRFQIYSDDGNENDRSRSRVRKDVCKKETYVSRRARSSSNCRQNTFLDKNKINSKLFNYRRSSSENRGTSSQCAQNDIVQLLDVQKTKHLTNDVKRRTASSIELWKERMRKSSGAVSTNMIASINLNKALSQVGIDKMYSKTNLRKSSVTGSINLQPEMSQNRVTNPNENIEQAQNIDLLKDALKSIESNEIAIFLNDEIFLSAQNNTNKRSFTSKNSENNNLLSSTLLNANSITPLDGPSILPLTPTKVHYGKCMMTRKLTINKENEFDVCKISYERDYLDDISETERKRDDNAPKLSPRFLNENVNAEQRKIVVGYIIRLGVHCYYSSYVIYQTIKLFNVAIDRICVKTDDIQLMALVCLWIILKQDAPRDKIPSATVILQLAKDLYINQEKDLLKYEKKILCAVKFNTRFADPFTLLSYYILNVNQDSQYNIIKPNDIACVYFCSSYMIDLSMLDENLSDIPVCIIARAAIELSLRFVYLSDVDQKWYQVWRSKQLLTEWEERMLNSTKQIMIRSAQEYNNFGSNVVYKKYMRSKHGRVSNFLHNKLKTVVIEEVKIRQH